MSDNFEKHASCSHGQKNATKEEQDAAMLKDNMAKIKHKIIVMSGKGGVGKSTVATNPVFSEIQSGL